MAAPGFGFSVGDVLAGLHVVRKLIRALNDTAGSRAVEPTQAAQKIALEQIAQQCQCSIEKFLRKNAKFKGSLGVQPSISAWPSNLHKVQWALCKDSEIEGLRAEISAHSVILNLILSTIQLSATKLQSEAIDECAQLAKATRNDGDETRALAKKNNQLLNTQADLIVTISDTIALFSSLNQKYRTAENDAQGPGIQHENLVNCIANTSNAVNLGHNEAIFGSLCISEAASHVGQSPPAPLQNSQDWKSAYTQDDSSENTRRDRWDNVTRIHHLKQSQGLEITPTQIYQLMHPRDNQGPNFRMHDQFSPMGHFWSGDWYDNKQLKEIDSTRTLNDTSSHLSSSMMSLRQASRPHIKLPQLALPTATKPSTAGESPTSNLMNELVQLDTGAYQRHSDNSPEPEWWTWPATPLSVDLPDAPTPCNDYEEEMEFPLEETDRLHQMHPDEGRHSRINSLNDGPQMASSHKRRASSPPVADPIIHHVSSQGDLVRRRENVTRSSPSTSTLGQITEGRRGF